MRNEKLFNETIDKLVKAYFEGTLKHGDCSACAVGNIVGTLSWAQEFITCKKDKSHLREVIRSNGEYTQYGGFIKPIRFYNVTDWRSDYSSHQLMDIEWAFETAPKEGDWEFNGLMAVVDVLEKIHECDKETTEATKKRFVKQAA